MSLTTEQQQKLLGAMANAKVGGHTDIIPITGAQIGVQAAAYGSGDVLGTQNPVAIECFLSENGSGVLQSVVIGDLAKQSGAIDVIVFNDIPDSSTFTDNSAIAINAADIPKIVHGGVVIISTDYAAYNANSAATKTNIGVPVKNASSTAGNKAKLWLVFVSRDTKTYTLNAVSANIGILQD